MKDKVVNIKSNTRKFHVTYCECGGIEAAVEQIKDYNSQRDIFEWQKEGRTIYEYVQRNKEPMPWCKCMHDEEESQ